MGHQKPEREKPTRRKYPTVGKLEDGSFQATSASEAEIAHLLGMKTASAAYGICKTALNAPGKQAEAHSNPAPPNFAELEPRDGIEAMLTGQMTAAQVALATQMHQILPAHAPGARKP